jgi:Ca2+-binding EF-hand superfamily protein
MTSPSKLKQSFTAEEEDEQPEVRPLAIRSQTEPPPSPTSRGLSAARRRDDDTFSVAAAPQQSPAITSKSATQQTDNLSKLPPQLLHSMREAFSVLDSNSAGYITASSVMETLSSLGLQDSINPSAFFPPGQPHQLSLPQFLNQLANILVALSPQQELLNAFAAFDDDDSGQVDIAELSDALLNTAQDPGERALTEKDIERALDGFTGRRVFTRNAVGIAGVKGLGPGPGNGLTRKSGDVFRYQEFVGNLAGGPATVENGPGQTLQAR